MMDEKMRLNELAQGFRHSAILLTACDLGIFAELGHERLEARELARRMGLDARALEIVLLALAADEILTLEAGRFSIAPGYAPFLLSESPQTMINILNHNYHIMLHWVRLAETLRTGQPIPRQESANPRARHARLHLRHGRYLTRLQPGRGREIRPRPLPPDARSGRRSGHALDHLCAQKTRISRASSSTWNAPSRSPGKKSGRPAWLTASRPKPATSIRTITAMGSIWFTSPTIIHMMGPEETALLARKSRQALVSGGTLVIKEFFLDDDRIHPPEAALFSVNMLVNTEAGKSYTVSETQEILKEAGFGQFREIPIAMASRLLIAQAI